MFTPGPWNLQDNGLGVYYVNPRIESGESDEHDPRHDSVIVTCNPSVFGAFSGIDEQEARDNAKVVSAAPDMLAALTRFVRAMEQRSYPELQGITSDAYAAITKATGEEV